MKCRSDILELENCSCALKQHRSLIMTIPYKYVSLVAVVFGNSSPKSSTPRCPVSSNCVCSNYFIHGNSRQCGCCKSNIQGLSVTMLCDPVNGFG